MPYIFTGNASERYYELAEAVFGKNGNNLTITHEDALEQAKANAETARRFHEKVLRAWTWGYFTAVGVATAVLLICVWLF